MNRLALNVDEQEMYAILDELARTIPRDPYQKTRESLRALLSWGVAIGFFYAKQGKPLTSHSRKASRR